MIAIAVLLIFALAADARPNQKIVGGQEATPGQFPWQGSLQFTSGSHTCGCSVIGSNKILSAAHCVGSGAGAYRVVLGLYSLAGGPGGSPETYTLSSISVHPDYVEDGNLGFPNDVSVITLTSSINFGNSFIQQITLAPNNNEDYVGRACQISGWGRIIGGGPLADNLRYTDTNVITNADCAARTNPNWVNAGHVCVYTGNSGGCNGDSGGPLTCTVGGSTYQVGVTSWVIGLCDISYPTAYSRVSFFNSWISAQ